MSEDIKKFLLYTSQDEKVSVNVQLDDETVWLTQDQMAELFEKVKSTISEHTANIFQEGELDKTAVVRKFRTTATDGKQYDTTHYNLDVIISVGYRVKSQRGTQFRIWATQRLREYIIKGFTLDDERLKQGGGRYFKELLQRIRDIRSSERNLYQQVTDIYTTSIDYKQDAEITQQFFATVQNKMHYAAHGMTAAELIDKRVDAKKTNVGLTNFKGDYVTLGDVKIAKNYMNEQELNILNLIVSQYLDFAELQASRGKAMTMAQWIKKLDDYLRINDSNILDGPGKISHKAAIQKARKQYEAYRSKELKKLESDFDKATKKLRKQKGKD